MSCRRPCLLNVSCPMARPVRGTGPVRLSWSTSPLRSARSPGSQLRQLLVLVQENQEGNRIDLNRSRTSRIIQNKTGTDSVCRRRATTGPVRKQRKPTSMEQGQVRPPESCPPCPPRRIHLRQLRSRRALLVLPLRSLSLRFKFSPTHHSR